MEGDRTLTVPRSAIRLRFRPHRDHATSCVRAAKLRRYLSRAPIHLDAIYVANWRVFVKRMHFDAIDVPGRQALGRSDIGETLEALLVTPHLDAPDTTKRVADRRVT